MSKVASFSVTIFDPNQNVRERYQRSFRPSKLNSLLSSTVRAHLDRERKKNNKETVVNHSIKFGVLCYETALIAFQLVTDLKGQEPEFVKIPINTTGVFTVFVKTLTGKTIILSDVCPSDSVETLKLKI